MKIVGLITEYNPFHNGHLYHIHESLRITGADAALVVMSGDMFSVVLPPLCRNVSVLKWLFIVELELFLNFPSAMLPEVLNFLLSEQFLF